MSALHLTQRDNTDGRFIRLECDVRLLEQALALERAHRQALQLELNAAKVRLELAELFRGFTL